MLDKFERLEAPSERQRLFCNECGRITIHVLEAQCRGHWQDSNDSVSGGSTYSIFRCGACDSVCYQSSSWNSEWVENDEDGNYYHPTEDKQYPNPFAKDFAFDTEYCPHRLDDLITELQSAFGSGLSISTTIMLRLIVEFIATDMNCIGRSLKLKIDNMHATGIVDIDQRDLFHKIRERGNAGAHGAIGMNDRQVLAAMSVISLLIERYYNAPGRQKSIMDKAKRDLT